MGFPILVRCHLYIESGPWPMFLFSAVVLCEIWFHIVPYYINNLQYYILHVQWQFDGIYGSNPWDNLILTNSDTKKLWFLKVHQLKTIKCRFGYLITPIWTYIYIYDFRNMPSVNSDITSDYWSINRRHHCQLIPLTANEYVPVCMIKAMHYTCQ